MKPEWENKEQPISNEDLQILERAREILSDESKWNSDDDRVCNDDDRKWSLFSSIKKLFKERKIDKDPKIQSNIKKVTIPEAEKIILNETKSTTGTSEDNQKEKELLKEFEEDKR